MLACWRGWALAALYMHQIIKGVESDGEGVLLMEWLVHKMNKTGGGGLKGRWRYQKRKEGAEGVGAETSASTSFQETLLNRAEGTQAALSSQLAPALEAAA